MKYSGGHPLSIWHYKDHVVDSEENGLLYNEALRMIERMIPIE